MYQNWMRNMPIIVKIGNKKYINGYEVNKNGKKKENT